MGQFTAEQELKREKLLDSPSWLATEVLDPWYAQHFEPAHYQLLDEVLAPWLIGETVRIDGINYDPTKYDGLGVLWSRGTLKSTLLRIIATWIAPHRKIRMGQDTRTMFCHQVIEKAIEHSVAVREIAIQNKLWRELLPEFRGPLDRQWDEKKKWRWPCFDNEERGRQATEYSFMCYGENSSKTGGHYTERLVDDWVTEESVTTDQQLRQSFDNFRAMDNLRIRQQRHNPWVFVGTPYHHQDTYKHLENQGGWLIVKKPAFTGSPKKIFDIAAMPTKTREDIDAIDVAIKKLEKKPPGSLNFPVMFDWRECVRSARAEGQHCFNCQNLLNPTPEGEQRFDLEAIREAMTQTVLPPEEMWLYIRCDPAISEKKSADYTAIIVGGVRWDAERHIIDGWVGREKKPHEIVMRCFTLAEKWKNRGYEVKSIGFEEVQFQHSLRKMAVHGIPEREAKYDGESIPTRKSPCPVVGIPRAPDVRKTERLLEMDGPATRREIRILETMPYAQRIIEQFEGFPFSKDDILDAIHDLWCKTRTPPRQMEELDPIYHPDLQRIISGGMTSGDPQLVGTSVTVRLSRGS
jgi:hypothetical protein